MHKMYFSNIYIYIFFYLIFFIAAAAFCDTKLSQTLLLRHVYSARLLHVLEWAFEAGGCFARFQTNIWAVGPRVDG